MTWHEPGGQLDIAGDTPAATILDACCLLNLHAGGHLADTLEGAGLMFYVSEYVLREEALSLWTGDTLLDTASGQEAIQRDFSAIMEVLRVDTDKEAATLMDLVVVDRIGEGEARTIALAAHRGLAVATDDRRARAVLRARFPRIRIFGTPELVYMWATRCGVTEAEIKRVLEAIETVGHYVPGARELYADWWRWMRG
jgi:predicted nucleic acid-binding protein